MKEEEIIRRLDELKDKLPEDVAVEDILEEAQRRENKMREFVAVVQKYLGLKG